MLIRLEIEQYGQRQGIYQYPSWTIEDYCLDSLQIPVPELFRNEEEFESFSSEYGNVSCWFTQKGFRDFGVWFGNLLCNKIANRYFSQEEATIYAGIISDEDRYSKVFEDDYQIVLLACELGEVISQFRPIKTTEDWFELVESFLPENYFQSIYSATGWK